MLTPSLVYDELFAQEEGEPVIVDISTVFYIAVRQKTDIRICANLHEGRLIPIGFQCVEKAHKELSNKGKTVPARVIENKFINWQKREEGLLSIRKTISKVLLR